MTIILAFSSMSSDISLISQIWYPKSCESCKKKQQPENGYYCFNV